MFINRYWNVTYKQLNNFFLELKREKIKNIDFIHCDKNTLINAILDYLDTDID